MRVHMNPTTKLKMLFSIQCSIMYVKNIDKNKVFLDTFPTFAMFIRSI